jgi:DNA-binding NtrC family response regulator
MAILHVEDSESVRDVVHRALGASGFAVVSVDGVGAAKTALTERDDIAGAFLDVRPRDGNGIDLYHWIAVHRPDLVKRVAFLTGISDTEVFKSLGAIDCPVLRKPFEITDLRRFAAEWQVAAVPGPC